MWYRQWVRGALLLALMVAGVGVWLMASASRPAAQGRLPLGSEAQCAGYKGLPAGWGRNPTAGMVHLDGGQFTFGTTLGYPDERPAGSGAVRVAAFWMDQTEVTNAQFAAFVAATAYVTDAERDGGAVVFHTPTSEELMQRSYAWWSFVKQADWRHPQGPGSSTAELANLPVTLVTQPDARAYAKWLGRDLPTEAEWEYAGKAGRSDAAIEKAPLDSNGRPAANFWQGPFPLLNTGEDHHTGLAPVGCYAASAFGLYDMVGNAWEWTLDVYTGQHQSHANGDIAAVPGRTAQRRGTPVVIKGGSFLCSPDFCVRYRASAREAQESDLPAGHIGFRTVLRGKA